MGTDDFTPGDDSIRSRARPTLAGYLESVASGCSEAAESRDRRVWDTMRGVLRLARQTIRQIERGAEQT
jgi:hypothetical protein